LKRRAGAIASHEGALGHRLNNADGTKNRARKRHDQAVALPSDDVAALHNRGIALRGIGRPVAALACHDRALAIHPNDPEGLYIRGTLLFGLGRYDEALLSYDKALAIQPHYVAVLHNRGIALRFLQRSADALASHDRALAISPHDAEGLLHRAIVLGSLARPAEALASCDQALALQPGFVEALHNRGILLLRHLKRPADALASHDRALAIRPHDAEGHFHRGTVLFTLKRFEEALAAYDKALALNPRHAEACKSRGTVLRMLKRPQEAASSYRQAGVNGADPGEIKYLLAGLGAVPSPASAPRKFITALFDQYADNFEEHLAGTLQYQAPAMIADGIARFVSAAAALDILDLGCGTGLVGALLRPLARTLIGVDLSPNMLEKARDRRIYDRLVCADLTEFLPTQAGQLDLVVAGDVFIYVGDLSKVFQEVRRSLRDGGLFGFSVETSDREGFALGAGLRYAHSAGYLRKLADDNRFAIESNQPGVIRKEEGVDVNGCVLIMRARA
jgi:predicted TPR repeat methyltransferase